MIYSIALIIEWFNNKDTDLSFVYIIMPAYLIYVLGTLYSLISSNEYTLLFGILEFINRMIIPFVVDLIMLKLYKSND